MIVGVGVGPTFSRSAAWTPSSVTGCAIWYYGDNASATFDTAPTPDVYESIPNGVATGAATAAGAARPDLGTVNSRNCPDLDGTNHYFVSGLAKADIRFLHNGTCTLYVVHRPHSVTGYRNLLDSLAAFSSNLTGLLLRQNTTIAQLVVGNTSGAFPVNVSKSGSYAADTTYLTKVVLDYGGATEVSLSINDGTPTTGSFGAAPDAGDSSYDLHVGCRANDQSSNLDGELCEIIGFDTANVSSANDTMIKAWLDERWNWNP